MALLPFPFWWRIKGNMETPGRTRLYIRRFQSDSPIIPDMDSKRAVFTTAIVSMVWLLYFNFQFTDAQVTFSRDWNAGKRSLSLSECSIPLRSAASVCQMLVNELRAIANCELKSLLAGKGEDSESNSEVFFPPRAG